MSFFFKHLRANRSGTPIMLAFQGGLFLFGVLLVAIVNAFLNDEQDYAAIGSLMALFGTAFGGLIRGQGAPVRYRMALSMGHTRRAYILADPVITFINCLIGVGAAWLLGKLELWLYGLLYPGWMCDFDVSIIFRWWSILLLAAVVSIADFCMGAFQLRFGAKGFMAIWFPLCFSPMIVVNALNAAEEGGASLMAQIGRGLIFLAGLLTPAMWAAVGAALLLVLVALSALCYLRIGVHA